MTTSACDDANNVITVDSCGEFVAVSKACGSEKECINGECACPEGLSGDDCMIPVLYVNEAIDSDVGHFGKSWADAFANPQTALAQLGDSEVAEIWVAKGRYFPGTNRLSTFLLKPNIRMYGGFAGDERLLSQRNIESNETILDGDIDQNDNATFTMHGGNAHHVVTGSEGALLDGFTIRGGNATADAANRRGGGLLVQSIAMTVSNCLFKENYASLNGGGVALMQSQRSVITNCRFEKNAAVSGGGLSVDIINSDPPTLIQNVIFRDNVANSSGGGMSIGSSSLIVDGCSFEDNQAENGGGISGALFNLTLSTSIFTGNHATSGGGASFSSATADIDSCSFHMNEATTSSGAINLQSGVLSVRNSTIVNNYTAQAHAAFTYSGYSESPITNSIIWGNTTGTGSTNIQLSFTSDATGTLSNSVLEGGCTSTTALQCGENILNQNPDFVNEVDGNLQLNATSPCIDAGDNSQVGLDASDANSNGNTAEQLPFDLAGNPRIADGNADNANTVDMGAHEYTPTPAN